MSYRLSLEIRACGAFALVLACCYWATATVVAQEPPVYGQLSLPPTESPEWASAEAGSMAEAPPPSWHIGPAGPGCLPKVGDWVHGLSFSAPWKHSDPDDPARHAGKGRPLMGTSWRNRPLHVGWLVGILDGGPLNDTVDQKQGLLGGYRLGWDFDHYWGTETRVAFANVSVEDALRTNSTRTSRDVYWDLNLLHYPWGDTQWRPFFSLGLGVANYRFGDTSLGGFNATVWAMPWGGGVKYFYRPWLALRFSLMDNMSFGGGGVSAMHSVSATGGVEVRFGGARTSYYPYHAGIRPW